MSKWIAALTAALFISGICTGCSHKKAGDDSAQSGTTVANGATSACSKEKGEHKAVHGGSLNAIVTCENGHAEVKLDGDKLQLWFVGGGPNTDKSVRVPDKSISVQIKTGNGTKQLVLSPKPLELAGEKVGDCSYFEGSALWLKNLAKFTAEGQITFRDKKMPLKIEYPAGYDPD